MLRVGGWYALFVVVLCLFANNVAAQNENKKTGAEKPAVQWLETKVKVVDPDGQPIQGAVVFCSGMGSVDEPNSHFGYDEKLFGDPKRVKTDENGIATLPYPEKMGALLHLRTSEMRWSVEHPNFRKAREFRKVKDDARPILLKRGYRIAATTVFHRKRVTKGLFAVVGDNYSKWSMKPNGILLSPTLSTKNQLCRLIAIRDKQPTLFSDLLTLDTEGKSRILLKDVELKPGVRFEGRAKCQCPPSDQRWIHLLPHRANPNW